MLRLSVKLLTRFLTCLLLAMWTMAEKRELMTVLVTSTFPMVQARFNPT